MAGRDGTSREVRAFDDLTAQERAEIETFVKPFSAKAGTVLFRQDMPQDRMYLLTSGRVGMSTTLTDGTQAAPIFQPVGGMDQFPKGLARAIGAQKISLGTEVISVRHDTNGVKVAVMDTKTGKKSELTADFCAVCLPLAIIAKLDISFSPDRKSTRLNSSHT